MVMPQINQIFLSVEIHKNTSPDLPDLLLGNIQSRKSTLHDLLNYLILSLNILKPIRYKDRSAECPGETFDLGLAIYNILHGTITKYFESKSRS